MNMRQHPAANAARFGASFWRQPPVWLSIALIGYLFVNVARAVFAPLAFAEAFGVALADPGDASFVAVYAVRTVFIAVFGALVIWKGDLAWLSRFLLVAVLIPLGDAAIVWSYGGVGMVRHLIIAGVVLAVALLARRAASMAR
jgi:hypothetical protein